MSARTTEKPLVSCVLIFYNGDTYLDEAIRSVVGQAGFAEWELILVDDGSTDDSTTIAQKWSATDPGRIRYVEHAGHANLGMSAARNLGIREARGDYIAFLDCDDVWLPSMLAHRMRVAAAHPEVDVIVGGTWRWYSWTSEPADLALDHHMALPEGDGLRVIEPPELFTAMYGRPGQWKLPGMCSVLIRRDSLLAVGCMEPEFRCLHEDQVLYVKLSLRLRVLLDPRPLALYRQHAASACSLAISAGTWDPLGASAPEANFLSWMETYVRTHSGVGSAEWDVVQRNLDRHDVDAEVVPVRPSGLRAFVRRHSSDELRRFVRDVRRRIRERRENGQRRSVLAEWSAQHVSVMASTRGSVLVVAARAASAEEQPPPDVADDLFASASTVTRLPLGDVDGAARFDLVVVPVAAAAEHAPRHLLHAVGRLLAPGGTAMVLLPGEALPSDVLPRAARLGVTETAELAREIFPGTYRSVETFGNAVTAAAVVDGLAASDVPGVALDHHDAGIPVLVALTVSPVPATPQRGGFEVLAS